MNLKEREYEGVEWISGKCRVLLLLQFGCTETREKAY
jgi:hypothetical protein